MTQHISRALTDWQGGYEDGLSCCNDSYYIRAKKAARYLSKIHPLNEYEKGKKQAAIDWLKSKTGRGNDKKKTL